MCTLMTAGFCSHLFSFTVILHTVLSLVLMFNVGPKSFKKQSDICQISVRYLSEFYQKTVRCKYVSEIYQKKIWKCIRNVSLMIFNICVRKQSMIYLENSQNSVSNIRYDRFLTDVYPTTPQMFHQININLSEIRQI